MLLEPPKARSLGSHVAEAGMVGLLRAVFSAARLVGPDRASDIGAALARAGGRLLPHHRIALANVRAVFPEKTEAEVAAIVRGAWESLGRTGAEYAHLKTLFDFDPEHPGTGRIEVEGIDQFLALRDDGKPGLVFSAHLANWELPAICAARFGLDATAVFRPTNDVAVAQVVHEIRSSTMGGLAPSRQGAAFEMSAILARGGHLGMLIDQHFTRGVVVDFLGRPALANPLFAKFARRFECPVHGVRVIRLPEHRFKLELTGPLALPRNAEGDIDIQGSMQAMTDVVAGWVREHPEQWLWMHRRWRVPASAQRNVTSA